MALLTEQQLTAIGFKAIGHNVRISDKASIYNAANISIGDNVRIDDFVVLSAGVGGIFIGSNIHIAVFSSIIGAEKVTLKDFCNISSRVSIYSSSDDYSGSTMSNPTIPEKYKTVTSMPVTIGRHVIIGCGTVVLPGANLHDGVAVGALSLLNASCEKFTVYAGVPAKKIKLRQQTLLELEKAYLSEQASIWR